MELQHAKLISDDNPFKCGCYLKNKIELGFKQKQNIIMPLSHLDYDIQIINGLVDISLKQKYKNTTDKFLQIQYSFPILPHSCIYKFVATFENQRIQGVVKQKEQAKKQYENAIKQGRQAVYAQINQKSIDIMNMDIGNIPPNQDLTIQISFMQQLQLSQNTFYKLYIPSKITPRYAQKYFEIFEKKQKKQIYGQFTWGFKINLRTTKKAIFHQSTTHTLQKINQNQDKTQTLFVLSKQCPPKSDFIFLFTTENSHLPSYMLGRTDISSTAVLSFIPKFCQMNMDDAYKAEKQFKSLQCDLKHAKGQYIFLIDRSGSMYGERIQKAKQALILFLKSLPQDSYFNIYSFGSQYKTLFSQSKKYNDQNVKKSISEVQKMSNDMGGTQIYEPLKEILNDKVIKGYPKQIFLFTDGGVSNTQNVVNLVFKNIKYSRVHGIGIGHGASMALIQGCAQKGKGKHVLILQGENVSQKVIQILSQCLSPIISQIQLSYDKKLVQSILPNPKSIPYILKNDKVNFYVTFKDQLSQSTEFQFSYIDSRNKQKYSSKIKIDSQNQSHPIADKMASYKRIKTLQNIAKNQLEPQQHLFLEDALLCKKIDKQYVVKESIKYQILSQYTAFLCVGKKLIDGQYQQFSSKGVQQIQIKANSIKRDPQAQRLSLERRKFKICFSPSVDQNLDQNICKLINRSERCQDLQIKSVKLSCASKSFNKQKKSACMGNPFQGVGDSIKSSISKPFKKSEQKSISSSSSSSKIEPSQQKQSLKMMKQKQHNNYQQLNKSQNISEKKVRPQQINKIINMQNVNGSWDDMSLINTLFYKNSKQIEKFINNYQKEVILTYLIVNWIEKNSSGKQYMLVVKKAKSWVNDEIKRLGYEEAKIEQFMKSII